MQIVNASDFNAQNQSKMDEALLVRFIVKPLEDKAASAEAGRPVYKDTEYVEIRTPGSRDAVCRPARAGDIARFPKHYEAFKARISQEVAEGTPLVEWPLISRSQAEELSYFNVKTVEQLIAMPDQNATQFMGINSLKKKAKAWLDVAKEDAKAAELKAELTKRDDEINELRGMVEKLTAAVEAKPATRKKVRRKKATAKKVTAKKE